MQMVVHRTAVQGRRENGTLRRVMLVYEEACAPVPDAVA